MRLSGDLRVALAFESGVGFLLFAALLLARGQDAYAHPALLPLTGTLLLLTLASGLTLRGGRGAPAYRAPWTLASLGIVTGIVAISGGAQSQLWILYLLPLYAASFTLPAAWVRFSYGAAAAALIAFTLSAPVTPAGALLFTLFEAAILVAGTELLLDSVSRRAVLRERLDRERGELARLAREMLLGRRRLSASEELADLGLLASQMIHDIRTPLTILRGSADLLEGGAEGNFSKRDLDRIRRAVAECSRILDAFSRFRRDEAPAMETEDIGEIASDSVRTTIRERFGKELSVRLRLLDGDLRAATNRERLERVIALCAEGALGLNAPGAGLILSVARTVAGVELRFGADGEAPEGAIQAPDADSSRRALRLADETLVSLGGALRLEAGALGEPRVVVSLPNVS